MNSNTLCQTVVDRLRKGSIWTAAFCCLAFVPSVGNAQPGSRLRPAPAVIDGLAEGIYEAGSVSLVEIFVEKSQANGVRPGGARNYPAPGEFVYVRVEGRRARLPKRGERIQAYLRQSNDGRWTAADTNWFQPVSDNGDGSTSNPRPTVPAFGVITERDRVGRDVLLKVVRVLPKSAAEATGIEQGDLLVEADGVRLESREQLDAVFARTGGRFVLTVRDVRTGRNVKVEAKPASGSPRPRPGFPSTSPSGPLGVKTELAFFKGEPTAKVTAVEPRSRADQAGIKTGMLILQINGEKVTGPKVVERVNDESGGRLELQVVNPDTGIMRALRVGP